MSAVTRVARLALLAVCVTGARAGAQEGSRAEPASDSTRLRAEHNCRTANGVSLRLDSRPVAIDTVWRFQIAERRWSRPSYRADIGAGWTGGTEGTRGTGMTPAPGEADARRWYACVGASVAMREPTLTLKGARGLVRLRVDLNELSNLTRESRGGPGQPRR